MDLSPEAIAYAERTSMGAFAIGGLVGTLLGIILGFAICYTLLVPH